MADLHAIDVTLMSTPITPSDPAAHLQEVLEREVAFRLQAVQDARAASTRIKQLEKELEETREELGQRNTYIGQLYKQQEGEQTSREDLIKDLGEYSQMLQQAEAQRIKLEQRAQRWSESFAVIGRATKSLLASNEVAQPNSAVVPLGDFTYYFYTSPHRIFRGKETSLRGWCYASDRRQITALRARLNDLEYPGKWGLEEPEVLRVHTALARDARPGFEISFPTLPGRHRLSLEVCLDHREWRSVIVTPIWVKS